MYCSNHAFASRSRWLSGSSSNKRSGACRRIRARFTSFFSPPLSTPTSRLYCSGVNPRPCRTVSTSWLSVYPPDASKRSWALPYACNTLSIALTIIHKSRRREGSREMDAFQNRLDIQPPTPQGLPSGGTIALAVEIAAEAGHGTPQGMGTHGCLGAFGQPGDDLHHLVGHHCGRRGLWRALGDLAQAQQAQGGRRQDAQQAPQRRHAAQLAVLDLTAGLEHVMEVFQHPAPAVPLHPFPGLLQAGDRDAADQEPFQRLDACRWLGLPGADHPGLELRWLQRGSVDGRLDRDRRPAALDPGIARLALMLGPHVLQASCLRRQTTCQLSQVIHLVIDWLLVLLGNHPTILGRSHH